MSRDVPEWRGKTDNTAPPPRVKVRVYLSAEGKCLHCTRFIDGAKLVAEYDHITPLILGGENCERNLQLLCNECHTTKTKLDVKLKAKVARVRQRHLGIKAKSGRPMPGSKASGLRKRMNGTVERRT